MSQSRHQKAIQATYFSILSNIGLAIVKWLAGFFGNSYALIADAIESTTDVFSSILVLLGLRYASKPPDDNHPYGHGRIEPLITFLVVGFLICSAMIIAYQSILHIQEPHELPKPWTLLVLGSIILWKEISYRILIKKSQETHSSALKADAWHHRSDAITSVAAFLGIVIALLLGEKFAAADDVAALFAAAFILYNSYLIFRPALGEIMDEHSYDELQANIKNQALQVEGIIETRDCLVRKSGMIYHLDIKAVVDGRISVTAGHDIAHQLEDRLKATIPELGQVLVHVEPA